MARAEADAVNPGAARRMQLAAWMLLVAWLLALPVAPARADSLARLQSRALPAWPAEAAGAQLLASGDRLLALQGARAWQLDATAERWAPVDGWPLAEPPLRQAGGAGLAQAAVLQHADGRLARLQLVDGRWLLQALPAPPAPLQALQLSFYGQTLWLLGAPAGGVAQLWQLRLDTADAAWQRRADAPAGDTVALVALPASVLLVQRDGPTDRLRRWTADGGWRDAGAVPGRVRAGMARTTGQAHALMALDGSDGRARWMTWQAITGAWAELPGPPPPAAGAAPVGWDRGLAWTTPGAPAPQALRIESPPNLLSLLDWAVIVVYLGAMLAIGWVVYRREKRASTADFFVGGRSIPFWAAGISLYATNTSSISYIAIPAKAFESNWTYMTNNLVAVCALVFVGFWIVPLLRRLDLMSVFQYLELRFHPAIRMLSSALCILVQVGSRLSVVLYLPALAIATITGLDVVWSVLLMGGFTIAYTALGGMKAVIWTDCAQLVVMAGGALFAIGFMVWHIDGGLAAFSAASAAADKTKLFDFSFDLTKATVWGFVFLVLFDVVLTFPKDQVLMQRVLSTPSDREAGRSIWAFAAIMVPGGFVFYGIGTALYVYYQAHPERMNPLLSVDATFPLFIAAELPAGLTGLIIAGIFAAAMSTLSSIINSVATLVSVDFYEKWVDRPDPATSVRVAEWMTVVIGLVGMGLALLLARFDIQSMFDVSIELAGLLGGGFAGAYTLGMFTRRANAPGVAIGVAAAIVVTTGAWALKLVHPYFYLAISILVCIVVGWCASWLFPPPARPLVGLTILRDPR
ncbi:MAG: sodium:solute symporter [Rubrivivax sp.]